MGDSQAGLLIALLVVAVPLVAWAKRVNVSYPIVLVLSGLVLGFVPGLPKVQLDPNLVLLIFLPPLLYWGAISAPIDVMQENAGQIAVLAIGLVAVTTAAVALVAHALIPGIPWAAAFMFGAIISPTDELAAVSVLQQFRLPRHVIAIVEGESLLNDATALVIYATALAVMATGSFNPREVGIHFVAVVIGSTLFGFIASRIAVEMWRRIKDRQLQSVISFTLPFLAYFPAQYFGLSGVLAVVTAGIYASRWTPRLMTPAARTQVSGYWNTIVFIANAVLFLLVGLQLHDIAANALRRESWQVVALDVVAVNVVLIVVRIVLVELAEYAPTAAPADHAAPDWKHAFVVAWSGLRGAVSLAAALAIPLTISGGARFPHRDLIVFLTFSVILVTLVGGGLTLPSLLRRLNIQAGSEEREEIRHALLTGYDAALERISELEGEGRLDKTHAEEMRNRFRHRADLQRQGDVAERDAHLTQHLAAERDVIGAQRLALIQARERGEIDNVVLRGILADLDLSLTQMAREDEHGGIDPG